MATNNQNPPQIVDGKAANTTATQLEDDTVPAGWMRLKNMGRSRKGSKGDGKHLSNITTGSSGDYTAFQANGHRDGLLYSDNGDGEIDSSRMDTNASVPISGQGDGIVYKVYKRRFFGLVQLVLLNIIVSWDVSTDSCLHDTNPA